MAYDASFDWVLPPHRRWRRWVARIAAVVALAACAVGVYRIALDAKGSHTPTAANVQPEVVALAASTKALAERLEALRPGRATARRRALTAVREAQDDREAAAEALRRRSGVANATVLTAALTAHEVYLHTVATVLERPESRLRRKLRSRARRDAAAWAAVPDAAGLPDAIHGSKRLAALARGRAG
jgi:hypothetical protein